MREKKKESKKCIALLQFAYFTLQTNFLGFLVTKRISSKDNIEIEDIFKEVKLECLAE